jgi:lipopolysaccharide transport system ATP-binding protein
VSRAQRKTVLFVSHNLSSVKQLCTRSVLIDKGQVAEIGATDRVILSYLSGPERDQKNSGNTIRAACRDLELVAAFVTNAHDEIQDAFSTDDAVRVHLHYQVVESIRDLRTVLTLVNREGVLILHTSGFGKTTPGTVHEPGLYRTICEIPGRLLNVGKYFIGVVFDVPNDREILRPTALLNVAVEICTFDQTGITYDTTGAVSSPAGIIHPDLAWDTTRIA